MIDPGDIVRLADTAIGLIALAGLYDVRRTLARLERRDQRTERRIDDLEKIAHTHKPKVAVL